jgi:hypothetical protein
MTGLLRTLAAPIIGALLAIIVMFGLVALKTAAPDKNPANQSALTYGQ